MSPENREFHELPEENGRPLSFIADHPGDSLARCADVVAFLAHTLGQTTPDDVGIGNIPKARSGFFWIARAVEDALRYEGERATSERKSPAAEDGKEALQ